MRKCFVFIFLSLILVGEVVVSTSDSPEATAYNNQRKVRFFVPVSDVLGVVYTGYGNACWAVSQDNGRTWDTGIIDAGGYPALDVRIIFSSLTLSQVIPWPWYEWYAVWKREEGPEVWPPSWEKWWLYGGKSGPSFLDPHPYTWSVGVIDSGVVSAPEVAGGGYSPPAVENDGVYNHVVWEEVVSWVRGDVWYYAWKLYYAKYDEDWVPVGNVEVIDSMVRTGSAVVPLSPSITVDYNGNPHVVYEKNDTVWYVTRESGTWSTPYRLNLHGWSAGEPFISFWGDAVYAIWRETNPVSGLGEIYLQRRPVGGVWEGYPQWPCSLDLSMDNHWPQMVAGEYVTWSERDTATGDWDVKLVSLGGDIYWDSDDPVNSRYSQIDYSDHGYVALVWTRGNDAPYEVVESTFVVPSPVYYSVSVGGEEPSPYTVYRDGYIVYPSGVAVDYAYNTLEYELPYLDPDYAYTLVVVGYHESSGRWNELVKVDGRKGKVLKVEAGIPETLRIEIPSPYYEDDSAVRLTIRRLTGDYASVSGIYLYRGIKKTHVSGGPQLSGNKGTSSGFYVRSERGVSGNGAVIEVSLPEECKVNLRIYDISGRLIAEPLNRVMNAGRHRIRWDAEAPGVYFYRLEAGDRTATGKIILVR